MNDVQGQTSSPVSQMPIELDHATYGFMASGVLFALTQLELFDHIETRSGESPSTLASLIGASEGPVRRLLDAAVALGLLEHYASGYVVPTRLAPFVLRQSALYRGGSYAHLGEMSTRAFAHLADAVRRGSAWSAIYGQNTRSPFDHIYADATRTSQFLDAMWGMGYTAARELVLSLPVRDGHLLVDLGGANGSFAIAALQRWSGLRAVVADLPPVRPSLEQKTREHELRDRLGFVACDFFREEVPRGDIISLGYILSDWSTEEGTVLLQKVHRALSPGGHVAVLERLFDDDKTGPMATSMMDLCMMLEARGQHRSAKEYCEWFSSVGFVDCQVVRSSIEKHMILGRMA